MRPRFSSARCYQPFSRARQISLRRYRNPTHASSFSCFELNSTSRAFHSDIKNALLHDDLGKEITHALCTKANRHPKVALSECDYKDGLLFVDGLIYVPADEELQAKILRHYHDHPAAGHPGRAATYELVSRDYWWPKMRHTIARYLRNCDTCARIKPARHAPYGFLKPLPIPQRRWELVSMDFIVGLPESSGFDAVLVVVDRLTKMAHFLPTTGTVDSEGTAALYRDGIFRLNGLPSDLVSDRGATFTSEFSRSLCRLTGITQNLSTAFHPQTDGQTERVNSILEQYLRGYCNYQQYNWAELLSMAEFSYNNKVSATTGVTPFFANYHYHPRYEIYANKNKATPQALIDYSDRLTSLEKYLRSEIAYAQAVQSEHADKHRSAPPVFSVGDHVWLNRRNIQTTRPSSKLDYKRLGRFRILEKVSSHAYKLDLPTSMRIHPVFHVSLLEPASADPLPSQLASQPELPPVIIDDQQEWEVEHSWRFGKNRLLKYFVRWVGYDHPSWQPASDLEHSPLILKRFHKLYTRKPGPATR
jgi:transposase InsO family protein